jgi:lipopolysaccharide transport system permease protein
MTLFRSLWLYRGFILGSVKREFLFRYHRSLLGIVWAFLNPLAMIAVYTVIFSGIMKARLPGLDSTYAYGIYLCAGLITWNFFSEILNRTVTVFIDNSSLLKKVNFPKSCLPVITVASECINFSIIFMLYAGFLAVVGAFPGLVTITVLPVLLIQVALAVGVGIFLGTLNVFFRDINQVVKMVLQFWFWLTPIIYPVSIVPEKIRTVLELNPMFPVVAAYQRVFISHEPPKWETLIPVTIIAVFFLWLGLYTFRKNAGEIIDEL